MQFFLTIIFSFFILENKTLENKEKILKKQNKLNRTKSKKI